ncbi:MAG: aminodeoxychorismate/anthranilate synthase component II [Alphaproteobacteria bacterium]|nr:aminodeoxychorismate/anthranilate synthase component II [Alphaproteobacteria bacterium]
MTLILIDNYDSFTYNLVQYFGDLGVDVSVYRNDQIKPEEVIAQAPKGIVISPGPSDPDHAGICLDLTACAAKENIPLLGVCLGHQTIGQAFGGKIVRAAPMHGKVSKISHDEKGLFESLPSPMEVTRYHSLVIERESIPDSLTVTAETDDGLIMGVEHKDHPIFGVQFHPESIATQNGIKILQNFVTRL